MEINEVINSDLSVWLSHICLKGKWYYEACTNVKCKKAAESFAKCIHCGTENRETERKFILPIEFADSTGSIWTTAFDECAKLIFKGLNIE